MDTSTYGIAFAPQGWGHAPAGSEAFNRLRHFGPDLCGRGQILPQRFSDGSVLLASRPGGPVFPWPLVGPDGDVAPGCAKRLDALLEPGLPLRALWWANYATSGGRGVQDTDAITMLGKLAILAAATAQSKGHPCFRPVFRVDSSLPAAPGHPAQPARLSAHIRPAHRDPCPPCPVLAEMDGLCARVLAASDYTPAAGWMWIKNEVWTRRSRFVFSTQIQVEDLPSAHGLLMIREELEAYLAQAEKNRPSM